MRIFAIVDASRRKTTPCGYLFYEEDTDQFSIELAEGVDSRDMPAILGLLAEKGVRTIDDTWTRRWIQERIPPSSRQNIGQILREGNLSEYDELALLLAAQGQSAQDDFVLRDVTESERRALIDCEKHVGEKAIDLAKAASTAPEVETFVAKVGAQLSQARKQAGISQKELSRRTGVQQAVISRVESGKGNPTLSLIEDLVRGLGLEVAMILK